jgi:hypothetical protein
MLLEKIIRWFKSKWSAIVAGILIISLIFSILNYIREWGIFSWVWNKIGSFINFLIIYWVGFLFVVFAMIILILWHKLNRLNNYVAISFKDNFTKNLSKNWDYQGKWELVHGGELSVTQSPMGGITKVGQLWRDYSFEFNAIIVHPPIGWVVRAQDLSNYYMIQLTPTKVRPHLRFGGEWLVLSEKEHKLSISENTPFKVRTEVRGLEIRVYVNDKEIYYDNKFFSLKFLQVISPLPLTIKGVEESLQIGPLRPNAVTVPAFTTGRVGFRANGEEHGRFSRCRV